MASNRDAAQALLKAASLTGLVRQDDDEAAVIGAVTAIGFALLDVADAIREQTSALQNEGVLTVAK